MGALTLYHMPGSCSRVTLNALEEIGRPYDERTVALLNGEQRGQAYLAINPKGKVPALVVDGMIITENPAILFYLANAYPEAELLPLATQAQAFAALGDLVWCGGTLHPAGHRFFRPGSYCHEGAEAGVRAIAEETLIAAAETMSQRLESGGWWYGQSWSIVDTYLDWVFNVAASFGFARDRFPLLLDHHGRIGQRPAFQRVRQIEIGAAARDGLALVPGIEL